MPKGRQRERIQIDAPLEPDFFFKNQAEKGTPKADKHLEDLVAEYLFQLLCPKTRRDPENAIPIETAVRAQHMEVRIES